MESQNIFDETRQEQQRQQRCSTRPTTTKRRSRFGCRNCKLRKIKCDETKPRCQKCTSFGVLCNNYYKPNIPDLQPLVSSSSPSSSPTDNDASTKALLLGLLPPTAAVRAWDLEAYHHQLDAKCQELVTRNLGSSHTLPLDKPELVLANRKLLGQAFIHPYLMHASLAISLAYERFLLLPPKPKPSSSSSSSPLNHSTSNSSSGSSRSILEIYHSSRATHLFSQALSSFSSFTTTTIPSSSKDAIWGTAASLAVLAFASPSPSSSSSPSSSWPLNPTQKMDLSWLSLSSGKMSLWSMANPLRSESLFAALAPHFTLMMTTNTNTTTTTTSSSSSSLPGGGGGVEVEGGIIIPEDICRVCGLLGEEEEDEDEDNDAAEGKEGGKKKKKKKGKGKREEEDEGRKSSRIRRRNGRKEEENVYFQPAHALARTLAVRDEEMTTGQAEIFWKCMRQGTGFRELLERRDKVALCLMWLWYRKMGRNLWWVELRARVEGEGIRLFLERECDGKDDVDEGVLRLLRGSLGGVEDKEEI